MDNNAASIKGQLAYNSRHDVKCSPERLASLRRDYHAARLAESVRRSMKEVGPFTPEQAQYLAGILTGSVAEVAA